MEIENDISAKADALWADELLSQQYTSNYFLDETQITLISTYDVDGNSIFLRDSPNVSYELEKWQSDKEKHTEIWNMFAMIIPKSIRADIVEFSIYTDGSEGELAGVERNSIDSSKWTLLVDVIDAYPNGNLDKNELSYSLVHEYGHILTASASQMMHEECWQYP